MRVIAGKARRTQLKTVEGLNTRPTTDRIKETLFNMINNDIYDSVFVDLFSGSGGIGIEALSRGAKTGYFVENDKKAFECIRENVKNTHFEKQSVLMNKDVLTALKELDGKKTDPADFIFMDPPYNKMLEKDVLEILKDSCLADEYTTIIIEASLETEFDYVEEMGFYVDRIKKYKTNKHVFVVKK